jgi:hypothetical protein
MRLDLAIRQGTKWGRVVPSVVILSTKHSEWFNVDFILGQGLYALVGAPALELLQLEEYDPLELSKATITSLKQQETVTVTPLGYHSISLDLTKLLTVLLLALRLSCNQYIHRYANKKKLQLPGRGEYKHVVVGVPASWNHAARCSMQQAALLAGFATAQTLTESTAACMAYGLFVTSRQFTVLVLDVGGGTTDVTVARKTDSFQVLTTQGIQMGDDDFDQALLEVM